MTRASEVVTRAQRLPIRWSFAGRLAIVISALIVAACVVLSWVLVARDLTEIHRSLAERGRTIADYMAREAELSVLSGDAAGLRQLADVVRSQSDIVYCRFFDDHAVDLLSVGEWRAMRMVLASSDQPWTTPAATADVWEFRAPVLTTDSRPQREELEFSTDTAPGSGVARSPRREIGTVAVGLSLAPLRLLHHRVFATAAGVTAVVTCLGMLGAVLLAKAMTRPLQVLAQGADRIARGDLRTTVSIERRDEVGALARSFNGMVGSLRARTERLEAINQHMQEANQLRTEFLATVSHELRTPLNVILGYCEMMLEGAGGAISAEQRTMMEAVQRYSKLQLDLVTNVLDFSRLTSGKVSMHVERFLLPVLLGETRSLFIDRLPVGVELVVRAENVEMETDRVKLQGIIRNLVENAAKFTERGSIVIAAHAHPVADTLIIEVRDTGPGIPAHALPFIFEAFRQVGESSTRRTTGVGLGLSIVQQLVHALQGSISVTSTVGIGSTFAVEVPRRWCEPAATDALPAPASAARTAA